jgi:hypothetical protein
MVQKRRGEVDTNQYQASDATQGLTFFIATTTELVPFWINCYCHPILVSMVFLGPPRSDLGVGIEGDHPGGSMGGTYPVEYLMDGYLWMDGWIIRMESHVTINPCLANNIRGKGLIILGRKYIFKFPLLSVSTPRFPPPMPPHPPSKIILKIVFKMTSLSSFLQLFLMEGTLPRGFPLDGKPR